MNLISICHRCITSAGKQSSDQWVCPKSQKPFRSHVAVGQCPINRFNLSPDELAALNPQPRTALCASIGDELRRVQCPTCSGVVMLKIFACQKHVECAIGKAPSGVYSCATCVDYQAGNIP